MQSNTLVKGWTLVISAFIIVFAFSTVDHAISPMVAVLEGIFNVQREKILWFISYCTLGIMAGLFIGPQLLKTIKAPKMLILSALLMIAPLGLFVGTESFTAALVYRFFFGLGAGFVSTIMWWLAYESIDKRFYTPMITVLTAARPMAVAAGVPLVMYASKYTGWSAAFAGAGVLLIIFCASFFITLPADNRPQNSFTLKALTASYKAAFKTPNLKAFFAAMFINRICYFGFYSMLGIWFIKNYHLTTLELARPLIIIGICETLINFVVPFIMKIGSKKLFYISITLNALLFSAFIWGKMGIGLTITLIALFAMTDRIYGMLMLIFIPKIFPDSKDRTTIGSLVTLVSWGSLAFISYIEGSFLDIIGLNAIAAGLIICLPVGFFMYIKVLKRTVFVQ